MRIAQVVFDLPLEGHFDYSIPPVLDHQIAVGSRVRVSFGTKKLIGFVIKIIDQSAFEKLKAVQAVIDDTSLLDQHQMSLGYQLSAYYGCSLGDALFTIIRGCENQNLAVAVVKNQLSSIVFYHCPSGRYEDILKVLIKPFAQKRQRVLILVADQVVLISVEAFLKKHVSKDLYVLGMRSLVFRSLVDIGLMIMIDEDNSSFKQEQTPMYETREVLLMRSKIETINIAFISTAATVELMRLVKEGDVEAAPCGRLGLAQGPARTVQIQAVDLNNYKVFSRWFLSPAVLSSLTSNLSRGLPSMLVVNHHLGVEELQKDLHKQFPKAKIFVFSAKGGSASGGKKAQGELKPHDILIGTSVLLRFKNNYKAESVILLDSDGELNRLDIRSCFRTWSLAQHFRTMANSQFLIQTRQPDHYVIQSLIKDDIQYFYQEDMRIRQELGVSPFGHQISVCLRGKEQKNVEKVSNQLYQVFKKEFLKEIQVNELEQESSIDKKGQHRINILLQGVDLIGMMSVIKKSLEQIKRRFKVIITFNVDP